MPVRLSDILPRFQPASARPAGAFLRKVDIFEPDGWMPHLSYVDTSSVPFRLLSPDDIEHLGLEAVHEAALTQLAALPAQWTLTGRRGLTRRPAMLECSGPFAAERILLVGAIQEALSQLAPELNGAYSVEFFIPARGLLWAVYSARKPNADEPKGLAKARVRAIEAYASGGDGALMGDGASLAAAPNGRPGEAVTYTFERRGAGAYTHVIPVASSLEPTILRASEECRAPTHPLTTGPHGLRVAIAVHGPRHRKLLYEPSYDALNATISDLMARAFENLPATPVSTFADGYAGFTGDRQAAGRIGDTRSMLALHDHLHADTLLVSIPDNKVLVAAPFTADAAAQARLAERAPTFHRWYGTQHGLRPDEALHVVQNGRLVESVAVGQARGTTGPASSTAAAPELLASCRAAVDQHPHCAFKSAVEDRLEYSLRTKDDEYLLWVRLRGDWVSLTIPFFKVHEMSPQARFMAGAFALSATLGRYVNDQGLLCLAAQVPGADGIHSAHLHHALDRMVQLVEAVVGLAKAEISEVPAAAPPPGGGLDKPHVEASLEAAGLQPRWSESNSRWHLTLPGVDVQAAAVWRPAEGILSAVLQAPGTDDTAIPIHTLLFQRFESQTLMTASRFHLEPNDGTLYLRADIPLHDDVDLAVWFRALEGDLRVAQSHTPTDARDDALLQSLQTCRAWIAMTAANEGVGDAQVLGALAVAMRGDPVPALGASPMWPSVITELARLVAEVAAKVPRALMITAMSVEMVNAGSSDLDAWWEMMLGYVRFGDSNEQPS